MSALRHRALIALADDVQAHAPRLMPMPLMSRLMPMMTKDGSPIPWAFPLYWITDVRHRDYMQHAGTPPGGKGTYAGEMPDGYLLGGQRRECELSCIDPRTTADARCASARA